MKILSEHEQLREARAILDDILGDVASPLHNPRHPKHEQVEMLLLRLRLKYFGCHVSWIASHKIP
jgi:hypothetical protein